MKGIEGGRLQRRGAEDDAVIATERAAGTMEKADGMQTYVNEFLANDMNVAALISQGFAEKINANYGAAEMFAKQNPFYIPKDVKELGSDHETAFVLRLAQALSGPEYSQ